MRLLPRARLLILLVLGALVVGTFGYVLIERWSPIDALYMTVLALSTVGFSEVQPLSHAGMVFTIFLITSGVAIFIFAVSTISGWVTDERLGQLRRRRRMEKRAERMRDHYIVCAYGRVGRTVARELAATGQRFLVIDVDEDLESRMMEDGVEYLIGDRSQEPVLRMAGVEHARGLICAVDSDATNVYIALMGRSLNAGLSIVARASEPESAERLLKAGANRVVSPYVSSGRHMALMAVDPTMVDALDVAGRMAASPWVEEISVDAASGLAGRTCGSAAPSGVLAIRHADGSVTRNPQPDETLQDGDLLLRLS